MSRKDSGRRSQALPIKHHLSSGGSGCSQVGSRWARQQIAPSAARAAPLLAHCTSASAVASLLSENIRPVFFFFPSFPFHLFIYLFVLLLERPTVEKKRVKRPDHEKGGRRTDGGRNLVVRWLTH